MMNLFRKLNLRSESGSTMVIVALSMVALLGFTAMVIDVGRLYSEKGKLQKALDSSVLAGAQELRTSPSSAVSIAKDTSSKNGYSSTDSDFTATSTSIQVTKQVNVPMTFAKVIGINNSAVSASAKAIVAPLKKANGIAPIVVEYSLIQNHAPVINCGESNPGDLQGNCGYLKTSAKNIRDGLEYGSTYEVGKTVWTDPGASVGQLDQAIQYLKDSDASKPQCQSASTADNSCKRVITVVVVEKWQDVNGKEVKGTSELKVYRFAAYWIDKYENKKLYGTFIDWVSPGVVGDGTVIGEDNVYGIKLVE